MSLSPNTRGLCCLICTAALLVLTAFSAVASARTYAVLSCDAAPGGANRAWSAAVNNRAMRAVTRCPTRGEPGRGMTVTSGGFSRVPYATTAEYRFTAPAGTAIERVAFSARFVRRVAGWRVGLESDRGFVAGCQSGPAPCRGPAARFYAPRLDRARWVRLVAVCLLVRGCAARAGREPAVEGRLTYAQVSVGDDAPPAYRDIAGPAAAARAWHRGSEWLRFRALDASGIKLIGATVNDRRIESVRALGCDYARARPCPQLDAGGYLLRTAATPFVDGRNIVRVASADAAGNVSSFARELWVDNNAPGQPGDVTAAFGEGWRSFNRFGVVWRNPGGQVAPIVAARYRLCRVGGACLPEQRVAGSSIDRFQLAVPGVGDWTLRLYLEDAAGNASWDTRSAPVHLRFDDVPPGRAEPAARNGWLNATQAATAPETIRLGPGAARPPSGIAGYSVTLDGTDPDGRIDVYGEPASYGLGSLPEGVRRLRARAISGAGVPSAAVGETEIRIDRSRPDVSVINAPDPGTWQRQPVVLRVVGTDQPGLSGMEPAPAGDPAVEDGAYVSYRVDQGPVQRVRGGQAVIGVGGDGPHVVTYRATDAAGNDSVERSLTFKVDRSGPGTIAFDPPSPAEPRRVVVRVADGASGVAGGRVEFRRVGFEGWTTLRTAFEGETLIAYFPDATLPDGGYELRAVVRDIAGNEAAGSRRTDGAPALLRLPLRLATRVTVTTPAVRRRVCRRAGRGHHRRLRCRRTAVPGGATVRPAPGRRTRIYGRVLTADGGRPVAGQTVRVVELVRGRAARERARLLTDAGGRISYVAPAGPSRTVELRYDGTGTTRPAVGRARLLVPARTTLRVDRRRVLNGDSVLFSGRLRGGHVPADGKLLALQAWVPGRRRWITFATPRSDRGGVWSSSYRFESTSGLVRYRFRAVVPRESGYPFEAGRSGIVSVTVRGR